MKYTVKVEIAVYEISDDMTDVCRVNTSTTAHTLEQAKSFAIEMNDAMQAILLKRGARIA